MEHCCLLSDKIARWMWRWEQSQQHLPVYQDLVTLCLHVLWIFHGIELSGCVLDQERSLMIYWIQWIRFLRILLDTCIDFKTKMTLYHLIGMSFSGSWRCINSWGCYCIGSEIPCKNASLDSSCPHHWQRVDSKKGCFGVDEPSTGYCWHLNCLHASWWCNEIDIAKDAI